jgi:transposase
MRQIREILRLHFGCRQSANSIAITLGVARAVVQECLRKAKTNGISWPLQEEQDDTDLERLLYRGCRDRKRQVEPDWEYVHRELRRPGVTRELLWIEYCEKVQEPYTYGQFCRLYKRWARKVNLVMRQDHRAGEKLFVDFAGPTIAITNPETGEITQAQLFVAVLGASNYTYAEACASQEIENWIAVHINAFEYLGGVSELVIPDNLRSAVTRADRYEPKINERYHQMARHYNTAIMPARSAKPRDKAPAEKGVQLVERWIIAVLRNRTFFSLTELNGVIRELLSSLNNKPFKKLEGSRRSWFEALDKPALKQLPEKRFEDAMWLRMRVGNDYHIKVDKYWYSVPHQLAFEEVDVRVTPDVIEILFGGKRVASHKAGKNSTKREHRTKAHQYMGDWTRERIIKWGNEVGPATSHLIEQVILRSRHVQIGLRACLGLLSLHTEYGSERLEAACRRAATSGSWTISSLRSMLKHGLDQRVHQLLIPDLHQLVHSNIRGASYFRGELRNANSTDN